MDIFESGTPYLHNDGHHSSATPGLDLATKPLFLRAGDCHGHAPAIQPAPAIQSALRRDISLTKTTAEVLVTSEFSYEPLDLGNRQIRLLKVLVGNFEDPICCDIQTFDLTAHPTYTALSYTWDHPDEKSAFVLCADKTLKVGQNLWYFLRQFRERDVANNALLWIDAICIDQKNIPERNHQVGQMRVIYSMATSVIVWLGPSTYDDSLAFEMVEGERRLIFLDDEDLRWHRSKRQWAALAALLEKSYWRRVWIIQEFLLARVINVWCGTHSASWTGFEHICRSLERFETLHKPHLRSSLLLKTRGSIMCRQRREWWRERAQQEPPAGFTLRHLIEVYASSESSDIKDKVYSLLGLITEDSQRNNPLQVDYSKSNVSVLVDVVRNQCLWNSPDQIKRDNAFVGILKDSLHVSHVELAMHILEAAPDLLHLIDVFNRKERVFSKVRCIDTIAELDFDIKPEGLSSKRTLRESQNDEQKVFIDPRHLSAKAAASLGLLQQQFGADEILSICVEASHGCSEPATSLSNNPNMPIHCLEDVNNWAGRVQLPPKQGVVRRASSLEETRSRDPKHINNVSPRVFVGSNGTIGITLSRLAQRGDLVCIITETPDTTSAILIRQSIGTEEFVGIATALWSAPILEDITTAPAHILAPELEVFDGDTKCLTRTFGMDEPLYDFRQYRKQYSSQKVYASADEGGSIESFHVAQEQWQGTVLRFFYHPLCMAQMIRNRLVTHAWIPQWTKSEEKAPEIPNTGVGGGGNGLGPWSEYSLSALRARQAHDFQGLYLWQSEKNCREGVANIAGWINQGQHFSHVNRMLPHVHPGHTANDYSMYSPGSVDFCCRDHGIENHGASHMFSDAYERIQSLPYTGRAPEPESTDDDQMDYNAQCVWQNNAITHQRIRRVSFHSDLQLLASSVWTSLELINTDNDQIHHDTRCVWQKDALTHQCISPVSSRSDLTNPTQPSLELDDTEDRKSDSDTSNVLSEPERRK
ncbi:heterokaryon incompatibility protein-domain-containing protein [Paraphoma chrysanthemicola]|uniref:Heterokaryon incompatibility protein-domain-containing protein n=1 Tax=Paraphoma chrysanthemicola TaxID=798071 RepID=A0A8K0RFX8_9PLEO|nr:heterokaryon incompatibility protein-domain-containing protein [Paraphoma chrysanthemicola]